MDSKNITLNKIMQKFISSDDFDEIRLYLDKNEEKFGVITKGRVNDIFDLYKAGLITKHDLLEVDTLEKARRLVNETHKQEKNIRNINMAQVQDEKLRVTRVKDAPHLIIITGDTSLIKNIIKNKFEDARWNNENKSWTVNGDGKKVNEIYGMLASKLIEAKQFQFAKDNFDKDATSSNLLKYGSSMLIFNEYMNKETIARKITDLTLEVDKLEISDEKNNKTKLLNALNIIQVSSKFLIETNFMKENDNGFVNFKSIEAKKELAKSIDLISEDNKDTLTTIANKAEIKAQEFKELYKIKKEQETTKTEQEPEKEKKVHRQKM